MRDDAQLIARALGRGGPGHTVQRNHFVAPSGTEHHEACLKLVQDGFMVQAGGDGGFQVTPLGAIYAREQMLDTALSDLITDRVSVEASVTASERVGPNSYEYAKLCESLEEDPGVNERVLKGLCRDLLKINGELTNALADATHTAAYWAPDCFDDDEHRKTFKEALAWHQSCLKRARQLVGDASRFALREVPVQSSPTSVALGAPIAASDQDGLRTFHAVFEILPPGTPIQWVRDGKVYVRNARVADAISMMAGVELPDQSIAVLQIKMGEALSAQAHERAAQFPDGRVVELKSVKWPSERDCFDAILAECEAQAQFESVHQTPVG